MEFRLPEVGEGIHEVELVEWLVQPGDSVRLGQALAEVLTDKATIELPAPFQGQIISLSVEPGSEVQVGQVILAYTEASHASSPDEHSAAAQVRASDASGGPSRQTKTHIQVAGRVRAAPSVRRMARQLNVDLTTVAGSGPGGRILTDDVLSASQSEPPAGAQANPHVRKCVV